MPALLLPAMCPECGAGDLDLTMEREEPRTRSSLYGSDREVLVQFYFCCKCHRTFTHETPALASPAASDSSPVANEAVASV